MSFALSIRDVSYTYHTLDKETKALSHINFQVNQGEFIAIVGPSGCGKSTLLHILAGLLPLTSGSIDVNGTPLAQKTDYMGYMLQNDQLLSWKTIYENAILGLKIQKNKQKDAYEKAKDLLSLYGLGDFYGAYPKQLSGGMRQRVALIRTLLLSPNILLLDEPFSALDYQTRLQVSCDIGTIIKKEKKTAILVTHDLSEAISMADRVIVLSDRPGMIKKIIPIHLTYKGNPSPASARETIEFKDYFNELWRLLNDKQTTF